MIYNTKKLLKLVKKYNLYNNLLVFNLENLNELDDILKLGIKVSIVSSDTNNKFNVISNSINNIRVYDNKYDICCFNNLLEYQSNKDIIKILKKALSCSECIIFDVAVSNYFCSEDNKINYLGRKYYINILNKLDTVIVEEKTYRRSLFEKHSIFVVRKR